MSLKHELFQLSQKMVLYDPAQKKFLVLKDANTETEGYPIFGPWDLPGGRVEKDEDLKIAVEREVREEIGDVDFELGPIVGGYTIKLSSEKEALRKVHHYYLGTYRQGEIKISKEHCEYYWATLEEIETEDQYKPWLKSAIQGANVYIKSRENTNDALRVLADFENYRKRQQESQKELGGYLIEKLILDIVPVLDNFRSATMHVPPEQKDSPWVVGIQYIEKQLEDVVKSNGVEVIEVKEGDTFDPTIHEAVESQQKTESDSEEQEAEEKPHSIVKVLQKGFRLGGKVIRPAKVTVK